MGKTDDSEDLLRRAFAAYFRTGGVEQPANTSCVRQIDGRNYVVLENVSGVLAAYRVRNDGMLRRLKRWPANLAD